MVLLNKLDKPFNEPFNEPASYRPLCLLDNMGKTLERLIAQRLTAYLESQGGLFTRQYGFSRGRDTVDAITEVITRARGVLDRKVKAFCAIITLDIRNAFNTARWDVIMDALEASLPRNI